MRFGIPENYDIEIDRTEVTVPNAYINFKHDDDSAISNTKSIISYIEDKHITEKEDTLPQFRCFRNMIHQYSQVLQDKLIEDENKVSYAAKSSFVQNKTSADAAINTLIHNFERSLKLQSSEVEQVIKQEEERQRVEQERKEREERERKRREEEKRKRKEEEGRRKKEEEERIRKENEEKKRIEQEEEQKRTQKLQEMKQEKEKQEKIALERKAKQEKGLTNFASVENDFQKYAKDIKDIKQNVVHALNQNKELKKAIGALKRKINPKFGQLSNSFNQLNIISSEVIQYVNDAKNMNELAFNWILNFMAKAIIAQAETEVTVKPTASLPLARLAYTLLSTYKEFEYYLTARVVKKCPFIIGYTCSIDSEEGRIRMGWKRNDNKWEDEVKYDERVAGICTVWAVMTRLEAQSLSEYSIAASWRYLARTLNTDPNLLTNAHFACMGNWWDACAKEFLNCYSKQAYKLLHLLSIEWTNSVASKKFPAAARLLILGEEWLQNNNIESIKEMEP